MSSQQVTVIATVLNEAKSLPLLLDSLFSQTVQPDLIIIVDGGSSDGSLQILEAASEDHDNLMVVEDKTCSLKFSSGPIARGRNQAIKRANTDIIVCADAGCSYQSTWLEYIIEPLLKNEADISIGGSCVRQGAATMWDVACAPFVGFDLPGANMPNTATGTARSLAFNKYVWERVGGFPENALCGEDTEFLYSAIKLFRKTFIPSACAHYTPNYVFTTAVKRLARYAVFDGLRSLTPRRLLWMLFRILCLFASITAVPWTIYPFLCNVVFEIWYALRKDFWGLFLDGYAFFVPCRILFSFMVPWIFTTNYLMGLLLGRTQGNEQNS